MNIREGVVERMADNVCPYCGFPNEAGVRVCKKCRKPYSQAELSHVITDEMSLSSEPETVVEKIDIDFSGEEEHPRSPAGSGYGIEFDSEEEGKRATQPIENKSVSRQFYAATFLQRFSSLIIDSMLVFIGTLIIWFAGISFSVSPAALMSEGAALKMEDLVVLFVLLYALFGFFYSMLFHYLSSRTIGKMLLGLSLVEKRSYRVSFYRILLRNILFILNLFTLFIGFVWIIIDERGQALHDKLSGTFVVAGEIKE